MSSNSDNIITQALQILRIKPNAQNVFFEILKNQKVSARTIANHLQMPRATVYDSLGQLQKAQLIIELPAEGKSVFKTQESQKIIGLINQEQKKIESISNQLPNELKNFVIPNTVEPNITFYKGPAEVKKIIKDILWYRDTTIYSFWAIADMISVFGEKDFEELHKYRVEQNLPIQVLWPQGKIADIKKYPWLASSKRYLRKTRIAPNNTSWNMSYWIYADKVLFVSGQPEWFGFIVQSNDFVQTMKTQFEIMWNTSEDFKK